MVTLILPAARDGPAFLGDRPVWLQQLPNGQLGLQQILNELDCANVRRIVFVTLQSHVDRYCRGSSDAISQLITDTLAAKVSKEDLLIKKYVSSSTSKGTAAGGPPSPRSGGDAGARRASVSESNKHGRGNLPEVVVVALASSPASAPETVCIAIGEAGVTGPIFVKDSDGSFVHKIEEGDYVVGLCIADSIAGAAASGVAGAGGGNASGSALSAVLGEGISSSADLCGMTMASLLSKSFIERTGVLLTNLVEKKLVSDTIAVGGYGFRSAADFVVAARKAEAIKRKITHALTSAASSSTRVFVSNVVQQLLFENVAFSVSLTRSHLSDWKTASGWTAYCNSFRNVMVALEGELFVPAPQGAADAEDGLGGGNDVIASLTDISLYVPNDTRIDHLVALKTVYGSRCTIIITSRQQQGSAAAEAAVRTLLEAHGVPFDALLLGVPSANTVLLSSATTVGW